MTPEQFLAKCEAAFAADEPQVIPANVALAMVVWARAAFDENVGRTDFDVATDAFMRDFTAACKEIES